MHNLLNRKTHFKDYLKYDVIFDLLKHEKDFESSFEEIFRVIKTMCPYVRTKPFKDKIRLDVVLHSSIIACILPIAATGFLFLSHDIQINLWDQLHMQGTLFRPIDKLHMAMIIHEIILFYFIQGWFLTIVKSNITEIDIWSKEVLEGVELSLIIFDNLDLDFEDKTLSSQFEARTVRRRKLFVPYFEPSLDIKSLEKLRKDYGKNMSTANKIAHLYSTYVNFRLFSRFLSNDCKELRLFSRISIEVYLLALVFLCTLDLSNANNSALITFQISVVAAITNTQSRMIQICALDKNVSQSKVIRKN